MIGCRIEVGDLSITMDRTASAVSVDPVWMSEDRVVRMRSSVKGMDRAPSGVYRELGRVDNV